MQLRIAPLTSSLVLAVCAAACGASSTTTDSGSRGGTGTAAAGGSAGAGGAAGAGGDAGTGGAGGEGAGGAGGDAGSDPFDAGAPDDGPPDAEVDVAVPDAPGPDAVDDDPFSKPAACTSNSFWFLFDLGTELMHPGMACNACHAMHGFKPPQFTIAGTAYPTGHEPDNCNSVVAAGATVVVTDAAGQVVNIPVNVVGNFHWQGSLTSPYNVKIVAGGKERAMSDPPASGDCNSCHTQNGGSSAPGRIVFP